MRETKLEWPSHHLNFIRHSNRAWWPRWVCRCNWPDVKWLRFWKDMMEGYCFPLPGLNPWFHEQRKKSFIARLLSDFLWVVLTRGSRTLSLHLNRNRWSTWMHSSKPRSRGSQRSRTQETHGSMWIPWLELRIPFVCSWPWYTKYTVSYTISPSTSFNAFILRSSILYCFQSPTCAKIILAASSVLCCLPIAFTKLISARYWYLLRLCCCTLRFLRPYLKTASRGRENLNEMKLKFGKWEARSVVISCGLGWQGSKIGSVRH